MGIRAGRLMLLPAALVVTAVLVTACGGGDGDAGRSTTTTSGASAGLTLTSPAFVLGATIPVEFTCEGENRSPPLAWSGVPSGTAELALTLEDPDAPSGTFVHWVLWGLRPDLAGLEAGQVPDGARQGQASSGKVGYIGPCPPVGSTHRYVFTLFALERRLSLGEGASADDLRSAARGAVLAEASLAGRFGRS